MRGLVEADAARRLLVDDFGNAVGYVCAGCGNARRKAQRYCPMCRASQDEYRTYCACGRQKPDGRGRRFCDDCERAPRKRYYRPCLSCGERTPKPGGQQLCNECNDMRREVAEAKKRARLAVARHPCIHCGKPKPAGTGRQVCDACRPKTQRYAVPPCSRCGRNPIRAKGKQHCEECARLAVVRQRARWRRDTAKRRKANPAASRRAAKRYRDKRTKEQKLLAAENQRIRTRERAEREGRTVSLTRSIAATRYKGVTRKAGVAGEPLALAVRAAYAATTEYPNMETYCRAMLGVAERSVSRWGSGEGIRLENLDKILFAIDRDVWDVYDPEVAPDLFSPLRWIDVVDRVSRLVDGEPLIGPDAVVSPPVELRMAA